MDRFSKVTQNSQPVQAAKRIGVMTCSVDRPDDEERGRSQHTDESVSDDQRIPHSGQRAESFGPSYGH